MKIVIPGGSGHIGRLLSRAFDATGDEVVVLSRSKPRTSHPWRTVLWDGRTLGDWTRELEAVDVLINLAGRSVNCRYTARNRREILDSRIDSTRILGEAIARATHPPRLWLQSSTATIYTHRFDAPNDEATGIISWEYWPFSIDVATAWERTFDEAVTPHTRKVAMRSAIVMAPDEGGPFRLLLNLVKLGLGGTIADGKQWVSWIHHDDFVRAVRWLIDHPEVEGIVNVASPNPIENRPFMRALREAWGIAIGLPSMRWMLEVGAFVLRSETELMLKSRRVVPGRLAAHGFTFQFPEWPAAARDLVASVKGGPRW